MLHCFNIYLNLVYQRWVTIVTVPVYSFTYFCISVKNKTYIAVFLTFIFMAKFFAIDANGLNTIFSGNDITFVKSNCKKKNSPKQSNQKTEFSQNDFSASQLVTLSGFCTSQFQFELFTWETNISKPIAVFNEHFTSILSYRYLDNDSPPPRLA